MKTRSAVLKLFHAVKQTDRQRHVGDNRRIFPTVFAAAPNKANAFNTNYYIVKSNEKRDVLSRKITFLYL